MRATVFELDPGEWRVCLGDRILPTVYSSRGLAVAGLRDEKARLLKEFDKPFSGVGFTGAVLDEYSTLAVKDAEPKP